MKEYKVGEVFTTQDDETVRCVRSNGLCSGCVFLTNIYGVPRCKAMDIACCERSREDGQNVIFEELEELEEHVDYPVGKVLAFEGGVVEVVEAVGYNEEGPCDGCALRDYWSCFNAPCTPAERADNNYIKFKKHVTEG